MASIEIGNYRIEHNLKTGRFDLYKKGEKDKWISLTNATACKNLVIALNKNEGKEEVIDKAITDELKRLNAIEEPRPANRSSILNSDIAKITRELLGKTK